MTSPPTPDYPTIQDTAVEAYRRGYTPVAIRPGEKRPTGGGWQHTSYANVDEVRDEFADHDGGVGLSLGEASSGLVDVDLDHPKARRAAELVLPPTPMQSGRPSSRWSHRWYRVTGDLPDTRRYANHDGEVVVELRATGAQTVIPPSVHPEDERYVWEGTPWGGDDGPAEIDGKALAARVATLAMISTLLEVWPSRGSRHDAYLALVGGLCRTRQGVHPLWETTAAQIVGVLAEASGDEDGSEQRIAEAVPTTIEKIRADRAASGWPTLEGIIGEAAVDTVRRIARDIEHLLGWGSRAEPTATQTDVAGPEIEIEEVETDDQPRSPLEERSSTWEPVDLGPYLDGEIEMPEPGVLSRQDGVGLFYPGRVNMLYAKRESGKSWVTLLVARERMAAGERVVFIDLEDEPDSTIARLRTLGVPDDEIRKQFVYLHPEDPLSAMLPMRYGETSGNESHRENDRVLAEMLASVEPALVIVDGMTVLYALHGLSSNASEETDRISSWLRGLTRRGQASVVLVDHVRKSASKGDDPIGSQHKMAMISGVAYHVWPESPLRIGGVGQIDLVIGKDRIGAIRKESTEEGETQTAAEIIFTSSEDGARMEVEISIPEEGADIGETDVSDDAVADAVTAQEPALRIKALRLLADEDFTSLAAWRRAMEGKGSREKPSGWTQQVADSLVVEGLVEKQQHGGRGQRPVLTARGVERLSEDFLSDLT